MYLHRDVLEVAQRLLTLKIELATRVQIHTQFFHFYVHFALMLLRKTHELVF